MKQVNFPHLAKLARKYLSPPLGSAASERLYSVGKNVLKTTRLRLKPENMEANLFLKYNIRALGYRTDFPNVADNWEAPNQSCLPDAVTVESSEAQDSDDSNNAEISILSPDS